MKYRIFVNAGKPEWETLDVSSAIAAGVTIEVLLEHGATEITIEAVDE